MSKIKFEKILLKSFLFLSLFLTLSMFSCKSPVISTTKFEKYTLRLSDFIKNSYYGDVNGISTSHVNYLVTITVLELINSRYEKVRSYKEKSPTGPDKSIFETSIDIPVGPPFKVDVIVDAIECTASPSYGCNSDIRRIGQDEFQFNGGKPYWSAVQGYQSTPSGNLLTMRPYPAARNSDGSGTCGCLIKLK
jgi:hypothetical protein